MHSSPFQAAPAALLPINAKCFDLAPYLDTVEVQNGWHPDGRRLMVPIANQAGKAVASSVKTIRTTPPNQHHRPDHYRSGISLCASLTRSAGKRCLRDLPALTVERTVDA